jgi:hypothetical protein
MDQLLIQNVPLNITCKKVLDFDFWNTTSFLLSHNTQQKATTPISTKALCLCEKLLSQGPKRLAVLVGFVTPKVTLIANHINLAIKQSKKRCYIVSCSLPKQQRVHPFHCLLAKLSLVKITPFNKYQRKFLIFRGIFAFQASRLT